MLKVSGSLMFNVRLFHNICSSEVLNFALNMAKQRRFFYNVSPLVQTALYSFPLHQGSSLNGSVIKWVLIAKEVAYFIVNYVLYKTEYFLCNTKCFRTAFSVCWKTGENDALKTCLMQRPFWSSAKQIVGIARPMSKNALHFPWEKGFSKHMFASSTKFIIYSYQPDSDACGSGIFGGIFLMGLKSQQPIFLSLFIPHWSQVSRVHLTYRFFSAVLKLFF